METTKVYNHLTTTSKKYKLTNETIEFCGRKLHRIQALIDFSDVKAGDLGGWIEKENNLSQIGDAWVYENAKVYKNACVLHNAKVYGNAKVYDNAKVYGEAKVYGNAKVYSNVWVFGNARVGGNANYMAMQGLVAIQRSMTMQGLVAKRLLANLPRYMKMQRS